MGMREKEKGGEGVVCCELTSITAARREKKLPG